MMQYQGYLKQSQEIYREFTIDELRLCLNVPRGKYENRTDNFMKLIIKKPVTEINEKTAYDIRYEVERKGRGGIITKIKFFLSRKKLKKLKNKNNLTILDKNDLEAQYCQEIEEREARLAVEKEQYRQNSIKAQKILNEKICDVISRIGVVPGDEPAVTHTPPQPQQQPQPAGGNLNQTRETALTENKEEWWMKYVKLRLASRAWSTFSNGLSETEFLEQLDNK